MLPFVYFSLFTKFQRSVSSSLCNFNTLNCQYTPCTLDCSLEVSHLSDFLSANFRFSDDSSSLYLFLSEVFLPKCNHYFTQFVFVFGISGVSINFLLPFTTGAFYVILILCSHGSPFLTIYKIAVHFIHIYGLFRFPYTFLAPFCSSPSPRLPQML